MECLLEQKVDTIFGYPGGTIMPLYDALYDYTQDGRVKHVLTSHEQGATHAADGYARSTGKVGVCFATSGPGATNTVTGIATANIDSSPLVVITGQVVASSIGRDAFQEVDIVGITLPITKHSYAIRDVEEIAPAVREAFQIASSGRPGSVLIDIPKNLFAATCEYTKLKALPKHKHPQINMPKVENLAKLINSSKRPVIYAGGGVNVSNASSELRKLAEKSNIPVATTLMCLGCFDRKSPLSLGIAGMHGERESNLAITGSDLIIAVGARFSDRVTGDPSSFAKGAQVVHIDIDRSEINKNILAELRIVGDVKDILTALLPLVKEKKRADWVKAVHSWKRDLQGEEGFTPRNIIRTVNEILGDDTIVATDVGQHQMWTAQNWMFRKPRKLITSGGMGTMGFGMGAAIGAKIANPKQNVVLFTGDGCFRMDMNELLTARIQETPILVIVMKNGTLGMVRQWQKLFFDKRYSATDLPDVLDYAKLADSFGLTGYEVSDIDGLVNAIAAAKKTGKAAVIACDLYIDENVWPIVPPGDSIENQVMSEDAE
jgi:acetolactate synthase-1/2/3 large subunit